MNKKLIFSTLILVVALAGLFFYSTYQNNEFQRETGINPQTIIPQFVDDREYENVPLPEDLKKIKEFVGNKLHNSIVLYAVTSDNVLVGLQGPRGQNACLFDIKKFQSNKNVCDPLGDGPIPFFKAGETIFYIQNQKILYYTLAQRTIQTLSGSELYGSEGYYDASDFAPFSHQKYSDEKITISVFDSSQIVTEQDNPYQFKKVKELTFTIK